LVSLAIIGFKPLIYNKVYPLKKKVINNGINKKGIKKRGATLWYKVAPRNDIK
jgi:hypothetical protein